MWHMRQPEHCWAMVSSYFVQLLVQNSMPIWYVDGETYPIAWTKVDKVYMPINLTEKHWCLAEFKIKSGVGNIYDSGSRYDRENSVAYIGIKDCLQVRLPEVLDLLNLYEEQGIDKISYRITFKMADNVPKQGGVFGDCGIWVCIFLFRLANNISLAVEDPVQVVIAYRERLAEFYFSHKVV